MKMRRGASSLGCSALSAARSAATSGRSCSAACKVFFKGDVVTVVEAPDRADASFLLLLLAQPRADLLERQVRLGGDEVEQPLPVPLERRPAVAGTGLGIDAARRRPPLNPANCRRGADVEKAPRLSRALARFHYRDYPHPEVLGVSLRHRHPRRCRRRHPNLICATKGIPCGYSESHQAESALAAVYIMSSSDFARLCVLYAISAQSPRNLH